jgi:hypothetical protein
MPSPDHIRVTAKCLVGGGNIDPVRGPAGTSFDIRTGAGKPAFIRIDRLVRGFFHIRHPDIVEIVQ